MRSAMPCVEPSRLPKMTSTRIERHAPFVSCPPGRRLNRGPSGGARKCRKAQPGHDDDDARCANPPRPLASAPDAADYHGMDGTNRAGALDPVARDTLLRYARDTWASLVAMTDATTGLPADRLRADGTSSITTSITNIGAYLWSALVADRLRLCSHAEVLARLERTLTTLVAMDRHEPSGQFFNWYDHTTGAKLTIWPPTGEPLEPILSSVDNGWLATGLHLVASCVPELASAAGALFDSMDFGLYYRPDVNRIAIFHAPDGGRTASCYDTIVSESRIASYIGIATGRIPSKEYFGAWRTFPDTGDWSWQETKLLGYTQTYLGVDVFEGAYPYNGTLIVPGWGGSMFEALMPALFVPEDEWGPKSWAINHPLTVAAQIHHGLVDAGYGYWGFSPANIPEGGYDEYGVTAIAMSPDGYCSNEDHTTLGCRRAGCAEHDPAPSPSPAAYTNGVVTPHASFLALRWAPDAALANLARLERNFAIYGRWGFHDSVNVGTGTGLGFVPLAGPGDHHGRDRQRARPRHAAHRVRHPPVPERPPAGHRHGGVQRRSA